MPLFEGCELLRFIKPVFVICNVKLHVVLCLKTNFGQNTSFNSLSAHRYNFKANGFKNKVELHFIKEKRHKTYNGPMIIEIQK